MCLPFIKRVKNRTRRFSESTYFICENPPHLPPINGAGIGTGHSRLPGFIGPVPQPLLIRPILVFPYIIL